MTKEGERGKEMKIRPGFLASTLHVVALSVYLVHIYFNWNSKGTGLEVYSPWWDNFAGADRVGGEFGLPWIPVSCDCLLCLAVSSSWACDAA